MNSFTPNSNIVFHVSSIKINLEVRHIKAHFPLFLNQTHEHKHRDTNEYKLINSNTHTHMCAPMFVHTTIKTISYKQARTLPQFLNQTRLLNRDIHRYIHIRKMWCNLNYGQQRGNTEWHCSHYFSKEREYPLLSPYVLCNPYTPDPYIHTYTWTNIRAIKKRASSKQTQTSTNIATVLEPTHEDKHRNANEYNFTYFIHVRELIFMHTTIKQEHYQTNHTHKHEHCYRSWSWTKQDYANRDIHVYIYISKMWCNLLFLPWGRNWGQQRGNAGGHCYHCLSKERESLPLSPYGLCNPPSPWTSGGARTRWRRCSPGSAAAALPSLSGPRSCAPVPPSPPPPSDPSGNSSPSRTAPMISSVTLTHCCSPLPPPPPFSL